MNYQSNQYWNWNFADPSNLYGISELSIEPILELKQDTYLVEETGELIYQSNQYWNWNAVAACIAIRMGATYQSNQYWNWNRFINHDASFDEYYQSNQYWNWNSLGVSQYVNPVSLSIEPILELKPRSPGVSVQTTGYQSNQYWNWNNKWVTVC